MNRLNKNKLKLLPAIALVITLGLVTLFYSCSNEFLKPTPLSFFEPAATFSTVEGLNAAMAAVDRNLRHNWTHPNNNNAVNSNPLTTEYMFSDLMTYGKTDAAPTALDYSVGDQLTPQNAGGAADGAAFTDGDMIQYFWTQSYNGIKYANTIIGSIDNVKGLDEATKNAYLGRALFHRAFRYYTLIFQFGDVPLITKLPTVPKFTYRSTKKEAILDMLVQDMEFAVQWVPDKKTTLIGMVNQGACRMLLAKLYLATGQFQKAKDQMDILIDQSGYALIQGGSGNGSYGNFINYDAKNLTMPIIRNVIWDLHRPQNKVRADNTEAVMVMPNEGMNTASFRTWLLMRIFEPYLFSGGITDLDGSKQAVVNYARNASQYKDTLDYARALGRGIGVFRPTWFAQEPLWVVNGVKDAGDLRHSRKVGNWVNMEDLKYNDPTSKYYGQHLMLHHPTTGKILCSDTVRCWYEFPHYKLWLLDVASEANQAANQFNGATDGTTGGFADIYLYRLAEAYLIRAEAKFYLGDASAVDDVNAVRKRARCTQMYTTVNIGDIMNERARELLMEEWRHVELNRVSRCLALSHQSDEWGNTYDINTYDKQSGREATGGSYWWQRIYHYNEFYNGRNNPISTAGKKFVYNMDKHNMYWPISIATLNANRDGKLMQAFGYAGYDASTPEWDKWQDAVADEDKP